jgi:Flp pilus assembly protein TadG
MIPDCLRSRGQVLVIFVGGLVLLLAIAALVFDLGYVFMIRRQEQNAADPGALAAARYIRPTPDQGKMLEAGCFYARQNGFFPSATTNNNDATGCTTANDPNGTKLEVFYPPSASAGDYMGRPNHVQVVLTRPHRTIFAGVLGLPIFTVSTSAVAAWDDGSSNSNSLVALDPGGCPATAKISGNNTAVTITPVIDPDTGLPFDGGYVHVNSSCGNPPTPPDPPPYECGNGEGSGALKIDSNGSSLTAPHVYVHGTCVKSNTNTFSAPLTESAVQIGDPLADLPRPRIEDFPAGQCGVDGPLTGPVGDAHKGCNFNTAGEVRLDPGVYYGGWRIGNNVQLKLEPGVYIIAGGGISLQAGGSIESVSGDPLVDARVMIFSTDNPENACADKDGFERQGGLDFTANSTFNVKGLDTGPWAGLLMWQDGLGCNPAAPVSLGGQTNLNIAGTIYAPKALVTLSGGSSGTGVATVQIISWQWDITGGATLSMPYDPRELFHRAQKGLVH